MAIPQTLGERLRHAMKDRALKRADVAKAAGVHPGTVSYWLGDKFPPDEDKLRAVAELLGVTPSWLRYGTDNVIELVDPESGSHADRPILEGTHIRPARPALPRRFSVLVAEFIVEADRLGATDEDMAFIHRALESPETMQLFRGGYAEALTPEQQETEMRSLVEMLRRWLQERVRRRNEARRRD